LLSSDLAVRHLCAELKRVIGASPVSEFGQIVKRLHQQHSKHQSATADYWVNAMDGKPFFVVSGAYWVTDPT
jgi:hypothetical protein